MTARVTSRGVQGFERWHPSPRAPAAPPTVYSWLHDLGLGPATICTPKTVNRRMGRSRSQWDRSALGAPGRCLFGEPSSEERHLLPRRLRHRFPRRSPGRRSSAPIGFRGDRPSPYLRAHRLLRKLPHRLPRRSPIRHVPVPIVFGGDRGRERPLQRLLFHQVTPCGGHIGLGSACARPSATRHSARFLSHGGKENDSHSSAVDPVQLSGGMVSRASPIVRILGGRVSKEGMRV